MIENNQQRPNNTGIYAVIYSDNTTGKEHFNGNHWEVHYNHPVAYWLSLSLN